MHHVGNDISRGGDGKGGGGGGKGRDCIACVSYSKHGCTVQWSSGTGAPSARGPTCRYTSTDTISQHPATWNTPSYVTQPKQPGLAASGDTQHSSRNTKHYITLSFETFLQLHCLISNRLFALQQILLPL